MERAQVFDWSLQEQLRPYMSKMKPRPSIYIPEFIAANQESRADNVLTGTLADQARLAKSQLCWIVSVCDVICILWLNDLPGAAD